MCGLRALRCMTGSAACCAKARHRCAMPTAPAAGSEWPIQLLEASRVRLGVLCLLWGGVRTAVSAPTSMGSPKGVPAQTQPTPNVDNLRANLPDKQHEAWHEGHRYVYGIWYTVSQSTTCKQKFSCSSPTHVCRSGSGQAFGQCFVPVPCSCVKAMSCG